MGTRNYSAVTVKNAVKNLDNLLWSIANNVVCTICQELFSEAATNQCGHSYCLKCIKKFHAASKNGNVNCPLCRHPIKRRSQTVNPILSKIAEIFSEAPAAFKEDVKRLTRNFEDVGEDLIKSARISGLSEEKVKVDVTKKGRRRGRNNARQTTSNDSVILCSVASNSEEDVDLKSVSQMESKSKLYVSDSPDVVKKLRSVQGIPSKEKVSDWLKDVDGNVVSTPTILENDGGEDKSCAEPIDSKVNNSGSSMIRVDYTKSKKSDGLCTDKTLTMMKDNDPYEFIASQRNTPPKKKRASRGRKRVIPQYESIQNFSKSKIIKPKGEDTSGVFDDDGSSVGNVQKPVRTYSTRSNRSKTVVDSQARNAVTPATIAGKPPRAHNPSGDSCIVIDDGSDIVVSKPNARRRILSSFSDDNSDSNVKKKPRLDTSDGEGNAEKMGKSGGSSKCSESPGWSRVSNLKMDFETTNKRRPCRKTLNISGGELNVNNSKMKSIVDFPLDNNKPISIPTEKDVYIEDLSQSSDLVVGFDSQQSTKKDFKAVVESMEEELHGMERLREEVHVGEEASSKVEEVEKPKTEVTRRASNQKTIPFALMGKIKKKKRMSIVFLKMGRLSPYLRKSDTTVVKLIFPSKSVRKASVGLQTGESTVEPRAALVEGNTTIDTKVNVEVQTTQCTSISREVQATQLVDQKSAIIQTEMSVPSHIFDEFNTPKEGIKGGDNVEIDLDTELQNELNKTWVATQAGKMEKEATPNSDESELIQRVKDTIDVDLGRKKEVRSSVKIRKQSEQGEESDSDIFIEQTPPRAASGTGGNRKEEVAKSSDESYLILSDCDNIPDCVESKLDVVKRFDNDENNQNEVNRKSREDRKICIVSSGIRNRKLIQKFFDKFKVEHLSTPKKDMTHLVVGLHENEDDELVPYCTPKFLYAIANKKWIVTETWLEECLKSNRIVAEEPFVSVDPVGGNACNVARLSKGFLLEKCEVYLHGKFVSITKEEFAELIRDCGGTIVPRLNGFSYSRRTIRMILIDGSDLAEGNELMSMSTKYRTLVMSRDVAIMSIQSYQIVNFTPFVQHAFSTEECVKWGYPLELVKKDGNDSYGESQP